MSFVYTTAIKKMLAIKCRTKVIQGGTSAGKTYGIIPILIDKAIKNPKLEISVVSESYPHLRRGALKDFLKIMLETGRWSRSCWNVSSGKYTFANGSYIEFFSADQEARLRGARRDILYMNEANNINFEAYYQLAIRTKLEVWLDFNPTAEFWAHTEVLQDDDAELIILTYKDNEALSPNIVKEIEKAREKAKYSEYWANWWLVYGLGEIGSLQGVVFDNWSIIDTIPTDAKFVGIGMDFGYSNDPTAIIEVYELDGKRILHELVFQTGLVNSEIAKRLSRTATVYADSAEPKSIEEIRRAGINIKGAKKGADSIRHGIDLMHTQTYLITSNSTNLIKEFRYYVWDTDRSGKKLNKPIDTYNHGIDAVRYHESMTLSKANEVFFF